MFEAVAHADQYLAVIDIGSNSVRLVVFSGQRRVPDTIFNEKMMCGLGAELGATGRMSKSSIKLAISTLKRFKALCDQMEVKHIHAIATAAVRDAKNGPAFVRQVKKECGIDISVIEGVEEGRLSASGVLSGEPAATGLMGDLGGGSLELAQLKEGQVLHTVSLPIGPMRLMSKFGTNRRDIRRFLREEFTKLDWLGDCSGQNLYLVGGAWRNIAKLMMREKSNPLPILHGYCTSRSEMNDYCRRLGRLRPQDIPFGNSLPSARREVLPVAAVILSEVLAAIRARSAIVSTYGLREGFIFDRLTDDTRKMDPFIFSCHVLAAERCRFPEHSDTIYEWTRPLFQRKVSDPDHRDKLHHAICLLGDIAWRGHPDFRAEKAVEAVLYGHFVGLSHQDRAYLAVALNQAYGAAIDAPHVAHILPLLKINELMEARMMGAALRLAQRLSGGAVTALTVSRLRVSKTKLFLGVPRSYKDLTNDVVLKRLNQLSQLMGRRPVIEFPRNMNTFKA